MRAKLTTMALALGLLVSSVTWVHAQGTSPGISSNEEKGGTTGTMTTTPADAGADNPFYSMRGEQIIGQRLYNAEGQEIGEIDNVVIRQGGGSPAAVVGVGVGGFLGIGERDVVIPLDQIRIGLEDRLTTSLSREQLGGLEVYNESGYGVWERTRPFGEGMNR